MPTSDPIEELVWEIQASSKYRVMAPELVRRVAAQELAKGRSKKEALKAARSKLHQIGGAYQEKPINYVQMMNQLQDLPHQLADPSVEEFCRQALLQHTSTRERLPIIAEFFRQTLAEIGPIHSIFDVACGMTPLSLPWIATTPDLQYFACDIYSDLAAFINAFFLHFAINGQATICDLTTSIPAQPVQLALVLKTIPCLEQLDKSIGIRLLEGLQAENILVSFPAQSLGGRSKGMRQNYEAHFNELVRLKPWQIRKFEFSSEIAFLIQK
ncbi:MAG: 16S rRNA methyltransferase [Anaerolineaceae bacterium]